MITNPVRSIRRAAATAVTLASSAARAPATGSTAHSSAIEAHVAARERHRRAARSGMCGPVGTAMILAT